MKKLLAILLAVVTMFSTLSLMACGEKDNGETGNANNFVFNGFEDFERDFHIMRVVDWSFGSVDINRDKKYVKYGEASAHFRPVGTVHGTGLPIIHIPTYSLRYEYDYKDMSKVEKISAWFYNAQDEEFTVGMGLQTGKITIGQTLNEAPRTVAQKFHLQPGWNYVEYDMDPKYLECTSHLNIKDVWGIFINFEYVDPLRVGHENAPHIYCDDIRFHTVEDKVEASTSFNLKSDPVNGVWEIADFEDERQAQFFSLATAVETRRPTLEVVNASSLNIAAKSGKNVLKVVQRSSFSSSHYYTLYLSGAPIKEAADAIGQDLIDNPHKYKLVVDYYNGSDLPNSTSGLASWTYSTTVCDRNGPTWRKFNNVDPFTWGQFTMHMDCVDRHLKGQIEAKQADPNSSSYSNYPTLLPGYTLEDAKFSTAPKSLNISLYGMANNSPDRIIIIDNIRIERIDDADAESTCTFHENGFCYYS